MSRDIDLSPSLKFLINKTTKSLLSSKFTWRCGRNCATVAKLSSSLRSTYRTVALNSFNKRFSKTISSIELATNRTCSMKLKLSWSVPIFASRSLIALCWSITIPFSSSSRPMAWNFPCQKSTKKFVSKKIGTKNDWRGTAVDIHTWYLNYKSGTRANIWY